MGYLKIILASFLLAAAVSAQQATLYFSPESTVVSQPEIFTVEIHVAEVVDLHGYSIFVSFPSAYIECLYTEPGAFLGAGTFYFPVISNATGIVQVDQAILGSGSVSGTGILFTLTFRAVANGAGALLFDQYDLRNVQNNSIPVTALGGAVQVGMTGLGGEFSGENRPEEAQLSVYPNPFNSVAFIEYSLSRSQPVVISIFDIRGSRVHTLFEGYRAAGRYRASWSATGRRGAPLASGLYLLTLHTNQITVGRKLMLIR